MFNVLQEKLLAEEAAPCGEEGERLLVSPYGVGVCACAPGFLRDQQSGACISQVNS